MDREIKLNWLENKRTLIILKISAYIVLSIILLGISWNAWPDITIDFGNELYMPWRITQGDIFYKDIDYYFGSPLSVYWNALWFKIFGTSFHTLVFVNLALIATFIFLLEKWLTEISNKPTAIAGVLFFISVFAFNRYVQVGNYNYVAPYSHPLIHGLAIILAMLIFIRNWEKSGKNIWLWLGGLFFGLAIINKVEIAITAILTLISYFIALAYLNPKSILNKKNLILLVAAIIPPLLMILALSQRSSIEIAAGGIFNQWIMLFDGRVSKINEILFYRKGAGTNDILGNSLKLLAWSWVYINITLLGILAALIFGKSKNKKLLISTLLILATSALTYFLVLKPTWFELFRPLPALMLTGFIYSINKIIQNKKASVKNSNWPFRLAGFAFGGGMLLKMALNAKIYHYGFALAMPATLLSIVIIVGWLPTVINKFGYKDWPFKAFMLGFIFTIAIIYNLKSIELYNQNDFPISRNGDTFMTNREEGLVINKTLTELESRLGPDQTLTVLPEGLMINYLLRRQSSVPYIAFMPDLFIMHKEQDIIDSFAKNPPDFIAIIHKNTAEYGYTFFGKDYAVDLAKWIENNYEIAWETRAKPLEPGTIYGAAIEKYVGPKTNKK